jgi:adenylyl-sulfate kinase
MSKNTVWQVGHVSKQQRAKLLNQTPCCIWLTGLSGAGKSTLALRIEAELHAAGRHVYVLDGDNVRHGLNCDLGFSEEDRAENIRRVAEVAHLMVDAGLIVVVAFISPFHTEREKARQLFNDNEFIEVFVDSPLSVCEKRDVKGFYKKARNGEIEFFTGISSPYEVPTKPELRLDTSTSSIEMCAEQVIALLEQR